MKAFDYFSAQFQNCEFQAKTDLTLHGSFKVTYKAVLCPHTVKKIIVLLLSFLYSENISINIGFNPFLSSNSLPMPNYVASPTLSPRP